MSPDERRPDARKVAVQVEGRALTLSNLGKVLYPAAGFTKAQVIDYYQRIAPLLLPHINSRPVTIKRYPDGVDAGFFYQRTPPRTARTGFARRRSHRLARQSRARRSSTCWPMTCRPGPRTLRRSSCMARCGGTRGAGEPNLLAGIASACASRG